MYTESIIKALQKDKLVENQDIATEEEFLSDNNDSHIYLQTYDGSYERYNVEPYRYEDFMLHYQIKAATYLRHIRNILLIPIVLVTIGALIQLAS